MLHKIIRLLKMRNTTGGKKHKKQGNASAFSTEMVFADEEQNYGKVVKILGHSKFEIMIFIKTDKGDFEAKTLIGNVRPSLKKKKMFANKDSFVIVSLRDFQENVCDIIHVYKQNHVHILNKKKLIPSYSIDNDKQEDDIEFETFTKKNKNKNNREETNYFDVEMEFSEDDETEPQSLKYDDFGNII